MYYHSSDPAPLTAQDIRTLRDADKIVFDHIGKERNPTGMGQIRATVPVKARGHAAEVEYKLVVGTYIEAPRSFKSGADNDPGTDVDMVEDDITCFEMIHTPGYSEPWKTVLALLRPGDVVFLKWYRGNSNGYTEDAGLVRDEVSFQIHRPRGKPESGLAPTRLTFLLRVSVCKPNSARLVRTRAELRGW